MAESACLQCMSSASDWSNSTCQPFLTSNWHFWQMVQMSAQCLLSKTEKAQISGQMQIICTGWQHWVRMLFSKLLLLWPCFKLCGIYKCTVAPHRECSAKLMKSQVGWHLRDPQHQPRVTSLMEASTNSALNLNRNQKDLESEMQIVQYWPSATSLIRCVI